MSYVYVPGNRPGINHHLIYENGKPIRANLYEVDLYVTVPTVVGVITILSSVRVYLSYLQFVIWVIWKQMKF